MADLWLVCQVCKVGRLMPQAERHRHAQAFRLAHAKCGKPCRHWADRDAWEALMAQGYREIGA